MVGSLNSSPTETMAGLLVALAEVRGASHAQGVVVQSECLLLLRVVEY